MLFWAILVVDFSAMLDDMSESDEPKWLNYLHIEGDLFHDFFGLFYLPLANKREKLLDRNRQ
jgi:hypothetical protein